MEEKTKWINRILIQMNLSKINLVIFKDDPQLWLQYYFGLYFNKPTIVMIKNVDNEKFGSLFQNPLVKEMIVLEDFTEDVLKEVADRVKKTVDENEKNER